MRRARPKFCPLSHRIHLSQPIIGGVINVDLFDVFDVEAGERVEAELERFIEKRARDRTKENAFEKAWAASERRHLEKRRKENAAAWCSFHLGQAERLEQTAAALAASHRQRAAELGGGAMP